MREKVLRHHQCDMTYDLAHWELLARTRSRAATVMGALEELSPLVYGSVARGDVHPKSDIDIILPRHLPSFEVESRLAISGREIVGATPWSTPKVHFLIEPGLSVTVPIWHPSGVEEGFHRFGGALALSELADGQRVAGVDKRLVLVSPTQDGHRERSGIDLGAAAVTRELGLSLDIVEERMAVLVRRDAVGRTGVFLRRRLGPEESVEQVTPEVAPRFQRRP